MKKSILLFLVCFALVGILTAEMASLIPTTRGEVIRTRSRNEEIIYHENFESGLGEWQTVDATMPPHNWHLTNNPALTFGGTGYSWFMGDPDLGTNGGYTNGVLIYLQTPAIAVPSANAILNFKVNYNMEAPDTYQEYDGWDGANVRISTNGTDWTVLQPTGHPYNCTSMYGFGYNGEGPNVPGWGGSSNGWQDASVDLSAYAGQEVMIRFVFGADPAYSTADNAALFGILVDNITLGSFSHDFNDGNPQGMTNGSSVPVGGNLWHIANYSPAPSGQNVMSCNNEQNTYNPNMMNYLYSPSFELPASGDIRADFMLRGTFEDTDLSTPDVPLTDLDYWGWEISPNDGVNWYAMSNPYGLPGGQNFVYVDAPEIFMPVSESYASLPGDISEYRGQTVRFRWYFKSDGDAPIGEALMIDDFMLYHTLELNTPKNLVAEFTGNAVQLNWDDPDATDPAQSGWITHAFDTYSGNGVGVNAAAQFTVAHRFTPAQLNEMLAVGGHLTKVSFIGNEASATYSVRVWKGGSTNNPGTLVAQQDVTNFVAGEWVEVTLNTPVEIEPNTELWFGYFCNTPTGHPLSTDGGPAYDGFGNVIQFNNSWTTLIQLGATLNYNWSIKGYVDAGNRRTVLTKNFNNEIKNSRNVSAYRIYRKTSPTGNFIQIGQVDGDVLEFLDTNPAYNNINYYAVTAVYGTDESDYSEEANVFVPSSTTSLYSHDDGTAEAGLTYAGIVLNKFTPELETYKVRYALVYIHTRAGNFFLKVFNENENGQPGEEVFSRPVVGSSLTEGWNIIALDNTSDLEFSNGGFFIGAQVATSSSKIGIDQDYTGSPVSFRKTTSATAYEAYNDGVFMIRAYVDSDTNLEDIVTVDRRLSARNYPNPFNPNTTISFNMPNNGNATVKIFNIKGQLVNTLFDGEAKSGENKVFWNGADLNGKNVTSGVYFYKVETENHSVINKMLLMK